MTYWKSIALASSCLLLVACSSGEGSDEAGPPRQNFQTDQVRLDTEQESVARVEESLSELSKVPNEAGLYSTQVVTGEGLETEVQPGAVLEVRAFLNNDRNSYQAKQYASYDAYTFNLAGEYEQVELEGYSWALQGREILASGQAIGQLVLVAINEDNDAVACSFFTAELAPDEVETELESVREPLINFCNARLSR